MVTQSKKKLQKLKIIWRNGQREVLWIADDEVASRRNQISATDEIAVLMSHTSVGAAIDMLLIISRAWNMSMDDIDLHPGVASESKPGIFWLFSRGKRD